MISLIDYNAGNIASVANALTKLNVDFVITQDLSVIQNSDKIILPGVGEASSAMNKLKERNLVYTLMKTKIPLLGICLGMQLFCQFTEEGNTDCFGIIPSKAKIFDKNKVKVPQIGWNQVKVIKKSNLLMNIKDSEYFYFANSYYIPINEFTIASSIYGAEFSSIIEKDNFFGVQFHPEKSGELGLKILNNFVKLC